LNPLRRKAKQRYGPGLGPGKCWDIHPATRPATASSNPEEGKYLVVILVNYLVAQAAEFPCDWWRDLSIVHAPVNVGFAVAAGIIHGR
jgi:hypothetical protein